MSDTEHESPHRHDAGAEHDHHDAAGPGVGPALKAEGAPAPLLRQKIAQRVALRGIALSSLEDSFSGSNPGAAMASNGPKPVQRSAVDVAEQGFSGSSHEVPYRKEMEQSFGADFSGVKAYSDANAGKANADLKSHAYAQGNQVAFKSATPDKATVAHELTHVLQHTQNPSYKADDNGIDTAGEREAYAVEAAVSSGKAASTALTSVASNASTGSAGGPALKVAGGPSLKKRGGVAREGAGGEDSKFSMGWAFSKEGLEKSYSYKLWGPSFEIPIVAVPGLNFLMEPSVSVVAAGGVNWAGDNAGNLHANLGVNGAVGIGLSYGIPDVASFYGALEAGAKGGFEFNSQTPKEKKEEGHGADAHTAEHHDAGHADPHAQQGHGAAGHQQAPAAGKKDDSTWNLSGGIALETVFKVGVKLGGGILDFSFEFGKLEVGKLTGLYWDKTGFRKDKVGWEWGEQIKAAFASIQKAIQKAKSLGKAALQKLQGGAKRVWNAAGEFGSWVTSW